MILHQIEALAAAGVTDIVLAVNYRPEIMEKALSEVSYSAGPNAPSNILTEFDFSMQQDSTSKSHSQSKPSP
jgi:mannose-1-phosphate guanylyltransferase